MRKCINCGGTSTQCRCPAEVVQVERLMSLSQKRGRLVQPLLPEGVAEKEDMILFEERFKEALASRSW